MRRRAFLVSGVSVAASGCLRGLGRSKQERRGDLERELRAFLEAGPVRARTLHSVGVDIDDDNRYTVTVRYDLPFHTTDDPGDVERVSLDNARALVEEIDSYDEPVSDVTIHPTIRHGSSGYTTISNIRFNLSDFEGYDWNDVDRSEIPSLAYDYEFLEERFD